MGRAQLVGQLTPDGHMPRCDRSGLSGPGVDLDFDDALMHSIADRCGPDVMRHYRGRTIWRRSSIGAPIDLIGAVALDT